MFEIRNELKLFIEDYLIKYYLKYFQYLGFKKLEMKKLIHK